MEREGNRLWEQAWLVRENNEPPVAMSGQEGGREGCEGRRGLHFWYTFAPSTVD